jgi:hypothetical protein
MDFDLIFKTLTNQSLVSNKNRTGLRIGFPVPFTHLETKTRTKKVLIKKNPKLEIYHKIK